MTTPPVEPHIKDVHDGECEKCWKLAAVVAAAREMRNDPCTSINWGCNSVQDFDVALAALDKTSAA